MDTVFALATARGKSGVGIFRISGPRAHDAARALCGALPKARQASLRKLVWAGEVLDEALVLAFPAGASFTGEDVVELHIHGSTAVIGSVARALSAIPGLRQAQAGEFTRRALENGRLDLAQVEGLADLIDAETEVQQRQALKILSGAVGRKAEAWRRSLVRAMALIEATIDFADEDVPLDVRPEVRGLLATVLGDLKAELAGSAVAERVKDGFEVAIIGAPNVGKSTLLNTLAGREAALTSARAGTTRDVIEVRMDLAGLPVTFLDTAGIRESDDDLEQLGIARGVQRAERADLRVFLLDAPDESLFMAPRKGDIVLLGKADQRNGPVEAVSGATGLGVDRLVQRIVAELEQRLPSAGTMTRERHRVSVKRAIEAIDLGLQEMDSGHGGSELVASELWIAVRALDQLVGRIDVENLLDEIFSSFCIGK
jgi:tRNA modification GTPase